MIELILVCGISAGTTYLLMNRKKTNNNDKHLKNRVYEFSKKEVLAKLGFNNPEATITSNLYGIQIKTIENL